tara:strand:- start:262 stop:483 length:222 start_codon:yes stop_codon:yes gene_type:complete
MTNKYKYGSISFRGDDMQEIKSLSNAIKEKFGVSLSNNKIVKLGILSLKEELSQGRSTTSKGATNNDSNSDND